MAAQGRARGREGKRRAATQLRPPLGKAIGPAASAKPDFHPRGGSQGVFVAEFKPRAMSSALPLPSFPLLAIVICHPRPSSWRRTREGLRCWCDVLVRAMRQMTAICDPGPIAGDRGGPLSIYPASLTLYVSRKAAFQHASRPIAARWPIRRWHRKHPDRVSDRNMSIRARARGQAGVRALHCSSRTRRRNREKPFRLCDRIGANVSPRWAAQRRVRIWSHGNLSSRKKTEKRDCMLVSAPGGA